jgi:hypothetical protein
VGSRKAIPTTARQYEPTIALATAAFRRPSVEANGAGVLALYRELDACATSVTADIALITWHLLYHTGRRPVAVAPSRGHSFRVYRWDDGSDYDTYRVVDPRDHRAGVRKVATTLEGVTT